MVDLLKEFIRPELFVLVPVLYLIGAGLKRSRMVDRHIPWVLGAVSVALSFLYIAATSDVIGWQEGFMAVFSGVTQGVLCAGASVYVNQLVKQAGKKE